MARVDYGQVPACKKPDNWNFTEHNYIWSPERFSEIERSSEKWIFTKFLNTQRKNKFNPGSVALVGRRIKTGRWCIIKVREVVKYL